MRWLTLTLSGQFRRTLLTTAMLCSCVLTQQVEAQLFTPLGSLSSFGSSASDVSADGAVVVGGSNGAFRWTSETGMVNVFGDDLTWATGVSADGTVIVGNSVQLGSWFLCGFRWTSETGGVGLEMAANAISADGLVIVGDNNWGRAVYLSGSELVHLDSLSVHGNASARGVSWDGSTIVGWSDSASGEQAFRWTSDGGMVGLGDLSGSGFGSRANDVSDDGTVVVGRGTSQDGVEAFRWTGEGGMVRLGDLPGGEFSSEALGISANGLVVVGESEAADGSEAFMWDQANGMRTLRDVLTGLGADLAGWTLESARAVSADGNVIVGWGRNPTGSFEAWRADLTVIPEPSTVLSTVWAGVLGLAAVRRTR